MRPKAEWAIDSESEAKDSDSEAKNPASWSKKYQDSTSFRKFYRQNITNIEVLFATSGL